MVVNPGSPGECLAYNPSYARAEKAGTRTVRVLDFLRWHAPVRLSRSADPPAPETAVDAVIGLLAEVGSRQSVAASRFSRSKGWPRP